MSRKAAWLFVAVLGLAVIVPQVVYAATGTFTSSSGSTALTAVNSSSGRAINASSNTSYTGVLTRTATSGTAATLYAVQKSGTSGAPAVYGFSSNTGSGSTYGVYGRSAAMAGRGVFGYSTRTVGTNFGVYGRTLSTGDGSAGVYGFASATGTGATCGVCGLSESDAGLGIGGVSSLIGAFGYAATIGVYGTTNAIGDGSAGLFTDTDAALGGHLIAGGADIAGTCTVAVATAAIDCPFTNVFPAGSAPRVVVTPTENPGAFFWVSAPAVGTADSAFGLHLASNATGDGITFNFMVVGVDPSLIASVSSKASSARASNFSK